jgi:hypothetical protein
MKHANNMREKVDRADNAEAIAKKAAVEKRGLSHPDQKSGRIEVGKGVANVGVGMRAVGYNAHAEIPPEAAAEVATAPKKAVANDKRTWIGGSSESKKMGGSHSVKGKL